MKSDLEKFPTSRETPTMTPRTDATVVISGRPPAVTDESGMRVFCAGPLSARRESDGFGGAAVVVLAPCSGGLRRKVCRVLHGGTVEPGGCSPLQNFTATDSDAGIRIDCLEAMDFWCLVPRELLA
jgi:hypothetical protein